MPGTWGASLSGLMFVFFVASVSRPANTFLPCLVRVQSVSLQLVGRPLWECSNRIQRNSVS